MAILCAKIVAKIIINQAIKLSMAANEITVKISIDGKEAYAIINLTDGNIKQSISIFQIWAIRSCLFFNIHKE